jgi:hypothetical protein
MVHQLLSFILNVVFHRDDTKMQTQKLDRGLISI